MVNSSPGFTVSLAAAVPGVPAGPVTLLALVCGMTCGLFICLAMFRFWSGEGSV